MSAHSLKPVEWVGSNRKDLNAMPESVQDIFGFALYLAQLGDKHPDAKSLKGFSGAGVLEIIENLSSDTYRAVYTVKFGDAARFPEEIKTWDRHAKGRDRES